MTRRAAITIFVTKARAFVHKDVVDVERGVVEWQGQARRKTADKYMMSNIEKHVFVRDQSSQPYMYLGLVHSVRQLQPRTDDTPPRYCITVDGGGGDKCSPPVHSAKYGVFGKNQRACWDILNIAHPRGQHNQGIYVHSG